MKMCFFIIGRVRVTRVCMCSKVLVVWLSAFAVPLGVEGSKGL